MSLRQQIQEDLKNALRNKNREKLSVLRMLQSAIKNREIEKKDKDELTDEEVIEVVSSEVKKRKDAAEEYKKVGKEDAAEKEQEEIEILMNYMPEQMSEEEIREEVRKVISEVGASSEQELGKVMGTIMPRVKGKADGALVNRIVREELE